MNFFIAVIDSGLVSVDRQFIERPIWISTWHTLKNYFYFLENNDCDFNPNFTHKT